MALVMGQVIDRQTKQPVENATVVIGSQFALSDDTGHFRFANPVVNGNYNLQVLQRYYKKVEEPIFLSGDTPVDIAIEMVRE